MHVAWPSCAWLLFNFFPFPVGHPSHPPCIATILCQKSRFIFLLGGSDHYCTVTDALAFGRCIVCVRNTEAVYLPLSKVWWIANCFYFWYKFVEWIILGFWRQLERLGLATLSDGRTSHSARSSKPRRWNVHIRMEWSQGWSQTKH